MLALANDLWVEVYRQVEEVLGIAKSFQDGSAFEYQDGTDYEYQG